MYKALSHLHIRVGDKLQLRMGYNQGSSTFLLLYVTKFQFDSPSPVDHYAIGKSKIWLQVGSVSFTLIFASPCFCSLQGYCLYKMACLWELWPSAWILNQSTFLCSGKHPDLVHLWIATRRKKSTHPLSKAGYSRRYLQDIWHFYFTFSTPPPLCSIKEPAIQTQ